MIKIICPNCAESLGLVGHEVRAIFGKCTKCHAKFTYTWSYGTKIGWTREGVWMPPTAAEFE